MKRAFYLLAAGFLLASCEHKELCLVHPHEVAIEVKFDWRDAPQADPDGMCVYFYQLEGGGSRRVDFNNTTGGKVELDVGKYVAICYNNDTEIVEYHNTDDFLTHGVYTREGNPLEPIYGNSAQYAPRAKGTEDERVVVCPDMMWGCTATEIEITDTGISYVCTPLGETKQATVTPDKQTITLYPHELTCTYTYEVRNVSNLKHMTQMCGTLSGMSGALTFSSEELDRECVTLPFEAHADGPSTVTGKFYTFGHHPQNPDPHRMVFYVVMDDGSKYCYKDGDKLDVTEQVHNAPDFRHVHLVIDGLDLPQPIENGHGYDPSVDDWEIVEEEIKL